MVHIIDDHMEDRPFGWHTFGLELARIGIAVSRHNVFSNGLSTDCLLPHRSNGV